MKTLLPATATLIALLCGPVRPVNADDQASRVESAVQDLLTFRTQLNSYQMLAGQRPTTEQGLKAMVEQPQPPPRRWTQLFSDIPTDPWGNEYLYVCPGIHNAGSYDLSSKGPDGVAATADDVTNWDLEKILRAKSVILDFIAAIREPGTLEGLKSVDWAALKAHKRHAVSQEQAMKAFASVAPEKVKLEGTLKPGSKVLLIRMVEPLHYDFELVPDPATEGNYVIVGMHP